LIPADPDERLAEARRLVASRCLYGVDRNPLAVETAKLSLWLITLEKNKPFTFLDHALKEGDSLVGVTLKQIGAWSLEPKNQPDLFADMGRRAVEQIADRRRYLESLPDHDLANEMLKAKILRDAEYEARSLRQAGDWLIACEFADLNRDA